MPYETTRSPKGDTRAQDQKVLALLRKNWGTKAIAARLRLTVGQVHEAKRRRRLFYTRRRS